jgi:glycosyltransferase involved in cell wall biosynthesis
MMERVSVIIPTYNRRPFLEKAIKSVLQQEYPHELIVVDDGSDDGTGQMISTMGGRIRYFYQSNRGPAAARNYGIQKATCDLIAFLDSDDRFAPGKLAFQADAMARRPDLLVSHTQEIWYRRGRLLNQKKKHRKRQGDIFSQSLELCAVGMSTVMARRALFDKVGLFDESLPCCEDYDLWLRVSCRYPFMLVDKPLTVKEGGRQDQLSVRYRVGMDKFRIRSLIALIRSRCLTAEQQELARRELARKCSIFGKGCLKHGRPEGELYLSLAERFRTTTADCVSVGEELFSGSRT